MYISVPWAIALATAGALLVVTLVGVGVRLGGVSAPTRPLASVAFLLGGGVSGFLALAFPPAWPFLAFIGTLLLGGAWREARHADVGLYLMGLGGAWSLLLGTAIINDALDPAVQGSSGAIVWLPIGAGVLVTGLVILMVAPSQRP